MDSVLNLYNLKKNSRLFNKIKISFRLFKSIIETVIFNYNKIIIFLILNIIILVCYR